MLNEEEKVESESESMKLVRTSSSSIFSLTLDEIQTKNNRMKSFGSMNIEDFIANIWTVDNNNNNNQNDQITPEVVTTTKTTSSLSLSRQGSLSIPIPLCKKTVDEIWFQIHKDQDEKDEDRDRDRNRNKEDCSEQTTLGEMTLEDFLVKAGVVRETTNVEEEGELDETTRVLMKRQQGTSSDEKTTSFDCNNSVCYEEKSQSQSLRKRGKMIDGCLEVVVERRQRRMIKNRESAARILIK
ncbi:hypothetical protein G4B88_019029 [Cannabis sativa]|uniref:Uncharacterized protein n=1 Tax=Cannabis sativa TaxID=3483 RepID=A0A7J6H0K6_CANSA|nr:hypothetical protein G4B88_019029 [Cannabis sativa]